MKVACPTCGAEVEFRYDDSFVRVCDACRSAVLRTDRGIETLGTVADLVPMDSPLALFAEGTFDGQTFLLVGMAQIKHAQGGTWQEWYAKFGGERWGWLAEAQGRFYLTFETELQSAIPAFETLTPGRMVTLRVDGQPRSFIVGELGEATLVAAAGEIPYRLEPNATTRYVDLSSAQGDFATIDYTDEVPRTYLGKQLALADLKIVGGEALPPHAKTATASRVACPNCNGSLELRAPDQTQRVGCPFCAHLIDVSDGKLSVLAKLAVKPVPAIPLGAKGRFVDGELTVIGYLQRSAFVDGAWWPFHEYLLYAPAVGFRWLVSSDSHWSYVQPIATGAVADGKIYDGVTFERFSAAFLRVDAVYGECYWQVKVGELVESEDFIAPPAMISRESTKTETTYSLSTYLTVAEVKRAFADDAKAKNAYLSPTQGVGANQPYPLRGWGWIAVAAFALLAFMGLAKSASSHGTMIASQTLSLPGGSRPTTTPEVVPTIEFSEKFHVAGGKNLQLSFDAGYLSNNWEYVAVDLVNDATGQVISVDQNLEYYSGVEDGESWSEGDRRESRVIAPIPEGDYVMRVEAQHGGATREDLVVEVRQGVFRGRWWLLAFGCLLLPFGAVALHARGFERRRRENANPYAVDPTSPSSGAYDADDDGDD